MYYTLIGNHVCSFQIWPYFWPSVDLSRSNKVIDEFEWICVITCLILPVGDHNVLYTNRKPCMLFPDMILFFTYGWPFKVKLGHRWVSVWKCVITSLILPVGVHNVLYTNRNPCVPFPYMILILTFGWPFKVKVGHQWVSVWKCVITSLMLPIDSHNVLYTNMKPSMFFPDMILFLTFGWPFKVKQGHRWVWVNMCHDMLNIAHRGS